MQTTLAVVVSGALIGGAIIFSSVGGGKAIVASVSNVSVIDGKQIIEIGAKGGYSPTLTAAKANMPTVVRVQTNGTFDCSSAITIPSIGYRANLPPTGSTDIEVPSQTAGTSMHIVCAMGMRSALVNFN